MRKYYYFSFNTSAGDCGSGVVYTDDVGFPLHETVVILKEKYGDKYVTIMFWQEVSYDEYKKMEQLYTNT